MLRCPAWLHSIVDYSAVLEFIVVALLPFVLSAVLTLRFSRPGSCLYILDHPTGRSLHTRPVPRSGGIAIIISILIAGIVLRALHVEFPVGLPWLVSAWLLVAGIGFIDDQRSLPVLLRLCVHGAAGALVLAGGFMFENLELPGLAVNIPPALAVLATWLFVVWMINLYNFMDGMDGFAGGMTWFGFGTFALIGVFTGQFLFAALSLIIASAALGFLCFNFPPARIFMGDAGAYSLGLLAAGFTLWGIRDGVFPFWISVLIFSPFIADATITLIWRTLRGEPVWKAHRSHFYQRLVQRGFGHRKTVLGQYVLMFGCAVSALLAPRFSQTGQWLMIACWTGVYATLGVWSVRGTYRESK